MLKEAVGIGETVLAAKEEACKALGVGLDEAEFEILQMPVKKTFGLFGGKKAQVKAVVKRNPLKTAMRYLQALLKKMNCADVSIEVQEIDGGACLHMTGEDARFVIGKRGETLDALQYLVGLAANENDCDYYKITLDAQNYRSKRKKTLEKLGFSMAKKAIRTRKAVTLEPMNPYERRIVHGAVQKVHGAISWSEGDDVERHVIIGFDKNLLPYKKPYRKPFYNKKRTNFNRESAGATATTKTK